MWPRVSENQKKDGKGQASVGLLLPAGGPRQGLTRGPQAGVGWVGLLAGPPAGRKRSRGAGTWPPGAADGPEERRPKTLAYRCSAAWGSTGALCACASCTPGSGRTGTRQGCGRVAATPLARRRVEMRSPRRSCAAVWKRGLAWRSLVAAVGEALVLLQRTRGLRLRFANWVLTVAWPPAWWRGHGHDEVRRWRGAEARQGLVKR